MMLKLLMSWDIRKGQDETYFTFIVKEFIPELMRLGLRPTEAWYTIYGDEPQILTGVVAQDKETIERVFQSDAWQNLHAKLLRYVTNYRQKVISARSSFQL